MSEQRERHSELYFGQTATTFTILGEFEMQPNRLRFNFETFGSVEAFEAGAKPIQRLRKDFLIERDNLETLRSENEEIFRSIEESATNITNVAGRNYGVNRLYISTVAKFLTIEAISPNKNDRPTANKFADDYEQIIQENLSLISQVIVLTWTYAQTHDEFLRQLNAEENSLIEKLRK